MLFDLRGRGRRRTVKAIYLSLAILMGGGLVFFGIGGSVQGGLFDAIDSSTTGGNDPVADRLKAAEAGVKTKPQDAAAWAALADVRFQVANNPENYNQEVGAYTEPGKGILKGAQRAWERHLELAGDKPDLEVANKMTIALGPTGLQDYDAAVTALEVVIDNDDDPAAARYAQLSILAELAGQTRKSTLAEERAVELSPKDQRSQVKAQIALGKQQAKQQPEPVGAQPEPLGG